MNRRIAIFYHALLAMGDPPKILHNAVEIVYEQMQTMKESGLLDAAEVFIAGVNGGSESYPVARLLLPTKAKIVMHGIESRAENLTIVEIEKWAKDNPGWYVLYCHSKSASHPRGSDYGDNVSTPWRRGMMEDLVTNWRRCVTDLDAGADIACSHWMWNMADGTQHIPCGNFLWAKSDFIGKLPSIFLRERIKQDGIGALSSRYEAEVFWGNGPRPIVAQYRPNGGGGVP